MKASQIRAEARKNLAGKWGKAAIATLIYLVIVYVITFLLELVPGVGAIIATIITTPLSFGFLISMFSIIDNDEFGYLDFFNNGFSNFKKVWSVVLNMILKLIVPIILFVIGIVLFSVLAYTDDSSSLMIIAFILYVASVVYLVVKAFSYSLSLYILRDNNEMSGKEIVEKSAELMEGNVWSYICLSLSFIGWLILDIFTLGIGTFWLTPYMSISQIIFYRNLTGKVDFNDSSESDESDNPIQE